MENKPFTPYVYRVTNKITGQFYVGSKIAKGEIGIDYFTSSTNKEFRNDFIQNPQNYICEKLFESENTQEVLDFETNQIIDSKESNLCLNKTFYKNNHLYPTGHAWNKGRKMTADELKDHSNRMKATMNKESTRKKLSESHKGKDYNKGHKHSEETKRKIREKRALQDMSYRKGVKMAEETKKKISETVKKSFTPERRVFQSSLHKGKPSWNKGIPMSEEARKKLSEANKGKKWYNNGIISKCLFECPEGWKPGRIYKRKNEGKGDYIKEHEDR